MRAPYAGIVTARHVEVGEVVQPGTPLMTGISLEQLRTVVKVPQSIVPFVRQHRSAKVRLPNGDWTPVPKITISPVAEPGTGSFTARLDLPPDSYPLYPGIYAKTAFVIGQSKALAVPTQAVVTRSEVTGTYVPEQGDRISFRHIRPGRTLD